MKKHMPLLFGLMVVILISCHKEKPASPIVEKGRLTINIGLSLSVDVMKSGLKSAAQTEDFTVRICLATGTELMSFETASAMPDTLELEPGNYYVEAFSDNNLPAAFENPCYYGKSAVFTITSNASLSVQVLCGLANTLVSVEYSDNLRSHFTDYSTTVSSGTDSLVFTKDETRAGYFQPLPLNIRVSLTYLNPDGSENAKILSGSIPDPQGGKHYRIQVNAMVENGNAMFHLLLDETEIPVEIVEVGEEEVMPPVGAVGYGELLITEIMADPVALSDTEGEWLEIYNNSDHAIDLKDLVLQRDETNRHTIAGPLELGAGEYLVLERTETATEASNRYVYGSAILLPNTGATLSLFNADSPSGQGALIFSVVYGSAGFPSTSGASGSLNPERFSAGAAILGASWCIPTSTYGMGDKGTPGLANDPCL